MRESFVKGLDLHPLSQSMHADKTKKMGLGKKIEMEWEIDLKSMKQQSWIVLN